VRGAVVERVGQRYGHGDPDQSGGVAHRGRDYVNSNELWVNDSTLGAVNRCPARAVMACIERPNVGASSNGHRPRSGGSGVSIEHRSA
jgi:hypothetical protein